MRKIGILILGIVFLASCENLENNLKVITSNTVGNDKDEHGCIASAGYIWSEVNQSCIRLFEEAQVLSSVEENDDNVASLVFNDEKSKLEVFLPDAESTVILSKFEDGKYGSEEIVYDESDSSLMINGVVKYKLDSE